MAGTRLGGRKAAATNRQRYGIDFYRQIGRKGGISGIGGLKGFAHPTRRASAIEAGRKGGKASRRPKTA